MHLSRVIREGVCACNVFKCLKHIIVAMSGVDAIREELLARVRPVLVRYAEVVARSGGDFGAADDWAQGELKAILDEVEMEGVDVITADCGIGFRHDIVTVLVGKKFAGDRVVAVYADFREGEVYGRYYFELEGVWAEEAPAISEEKTPFTYKLVEEIPWEHIRPEWYHGIREMVHALADAELRGDLESAVRDVKSRLEAGSWIYDYGHVLRALLRAAEEMGVTA